MNTEKEIESLAEYIRFIKAQGISAEKSRELIGNFIENKARKNAIPLHGYFELTPFCNFDCKMCYIRLEKNVYNTSKLLSIIEWKQIIDQAYKAGMRKATLSGGECLTYSGFLDIYSYLYEMGLRPSILTNGSLITNEQIDFFKQNKPGVIQITIYGSSEEAYEKVTGRALFRNVLKNILAIRDSGLPIQLAITPNRFMWDDINPLLELVHTLKIPYAINCKLITPRTDTGKQLEDLTIDQYIELYRIRARLENCNLIPIEPSELPEENRIGQETFGLLCGAGRSTFAINYEGKMMPCSSLSEFSVSVLDYGFNKAWESINIYAANYAIPCECKSCAYFPICIPCQGLHKDAPAGHCNPIICERTKKIAQAGFYNYTEENTIL